MDIGSAKFGSSTDSAVATDGNLTVPVGNLAVPRIWQCHGRQFGSAKFGSATGLAVPNLAVLVWHCHGRQFGSATDSSGFGRANFGSATNLAVPRTAVWQCQLWQCHGFGSASDRSPAVPNLSKLWIRQCQGRQFSNAKFRNATASAVPRRQFGDAKCGQLHGFGSATDGSLAVPKLAVPRMAVWRCQIWQSHVRTAVGQGWILQCDGFSSATDGSLAKSN